MKYSRFFAALVALALILGAAKAGANDFADWYGNVARYGEGARNTGLTVFPTLTIPMGGEFEGMGTAYTAVARGAGFFEANPAASSRLEFTEFALFHNNLIADTNMESFVYTMRNDAFGFGVAGKYLHVPFTAYDDFGNQRATTRFSETILGVNASYNFLRGFYFQGVSVGGNLKFALRPLTAADLGRTDIEDQSLASVMMDLGVLTSFNFLKLYSSQSRNTSVGVSIKNLGTNAGGEPLPTSVTGGIAYSPARPVVLAADYSVPFNLFADVPAEDHGFAVGTTVQITDFLSMHSGLLWRGGNPRVSAGGSVALHNRMSITFNYTLDLTTQLAGVDRFSVSSRFSLGDRGRASRAEMMRSYYLDALVAFAVGDLERTVDLCRRALELDPSFEPAAETLLTASRMLELQRRMESIRTVE